MQLMSASCGLTPVNLPMSSYSDARTPPTTAGRRLEPHVGHRARRHREPARARGRARGMVILSEEPADTGKGPCARLGPPRACRSTQVRPAKDRCSHRPRFRLRPRMAPALDDASTGSSQLGRIRSAAELHLAREPAFRQSLDAAPDAAPFVLRNDAPLISRFNASRPDTEDPYYVRLEVPPSPFTGSLGAPVVPSLRILALGQTTSWSSPNPSTGGRCWPTFVKSLCHTPSWNWTLVSRARPPDIAGGRERPGLSFELLAWKR